MIDLTKAPLPDSLSGLDAELAAIDAEVARQYQVDAWAADPVVWAEQKLKDTLWSGQKQIMRAVRDHRKTAIPTAHELGKSFSAGLIAGWWIDSHKLGEAYVVTTAPTAPQVRLILWKEIGRVHSRGKLAGRVNQVEWKVKNAGKDETVAIGRKPNDYAPDAFQGIHSPYVLVIVDEANGVRGALHHALDSLMANDQSKLLMIGNPDDPSGEFFDACKPGSGFHVVHIGAFDSPNFTGEPMPDKVLQQLIGRTYVEERREKWARTWFWVDAQGARVEPEVVGMRGPANGVRCIPPPDGKLEDTHPFWQSKVLGEFPVQSSAGSLIPLTWIRAAQEREMEPTGPNELGLDVGASEHGDPSCLGHRRGPVFRVLFEVREPDTMKSTGMLLQYLMNASIGASVAKVDYIGVGRGVVDRCKEQGHPVHPISVGEAGVKTVCLVCHHTWDDLMGKEDPKKGMCPACKSESIQRVYANLLSELWWDIRGLFERGEIDIDQADEELASELLTLRWEPNSKGQTKVSYGSGPSPNRADALMIAFAPVREPPKKKEYWATW